MQGAHQTARRVGHDWLDLPVTPGRNLAQVEDANVLISSARYHGRVVPGHDTPYRSIPSPFCVHQLPVDQVGGIIELGGPHKAPPIPAARHHPLPVGGAIDGANVPGVAKAHHVGGLIRGRVQLSCVDLGIEAGPGNEWAAIMRGGLDQGQRVEISLFAGPDIVVEGGGVAGLPVADVDGGVSTG